MLAHSAYATLNTWVVAPFRLLLLGSLYTALVLWISTHHLPWLDSHSLSLLICVAHRVSTQWVMLGVNVGCLVVCDVALQQWHDWRVCPSVSTAWTHYCVTTILCCRDPVWHGRAMFSVHALIYLYTPDSVSALDIHSVFLVLAIGAVYRG